MPRHARTLVLLLVLLLLPGFALSAEIVYLVRTGTDGSGNPMFRVADSRDTYLSGLFELTRNSKAMNEAARYYEATQKNSTAAALQAKGYNQSQIAAALQNYATEPVFIEVTNSSSGSYNDWKGRFSVQYGNGQAYTYSSPRVVYAMAGDVARSGDRSLIEQTLVHEVAHGVMAKAQSQYALPDTPWLSKAHSGGSTTDEQLAYIEGWAEFTGAYFTGRLTIAGDQAKAIDTNWYGRKSDGSYKSLNELSATEGWNATILYHIAVQGRNQNAMWKMTQVMAAVRPQSTMQLLSALTQYYPDLAPTVNGVLYQDSGGQAGSPNGQTYTSNVQGQYGGYSSNVQGQYTGTSSNVQGRYTPSTNPSLEQLWYGQGGQTGQGAYTTYNQVRSYQTQYGGTTADPMQLSSIAQETQQLQSLYWQKKQEIDQLPWYRFLEKSKMNRDLEMIADLYNRQLQLQESIMASGTGYAAQPDATPAGGSSGPLEPKKTIQSIVDSVSSADTAAAMEALKVHKELFERRKAQRLKGPQGER